MNSMENSVTKIKIWRKSREGIILSINKQLVKYTWDKFNSMYIMVDQFHAMPNGETQKKIDRYNELINGLVADTMILDAQRAAGDHHNELLQHIIMGDKVQALQREFDMPIPKIVEECKRRKQLLYTADFSGLKETQVEYRVRKAKEKRAEDMYHRGEISNANESMANVKGADKLKQLLQNEENN